MKKYCPIVYVDQWGEIHPREKVKETLYKKINQRIDYIKQNDNIYVYTTYVIRITQQNNLFN